jgi:ferredoxin
MTKQKKINKIIITNKCIGCGSCQFVCPEIFEIDKSRNVKIKNLDRAPELLEKIDLAVSGCPTGAIKVASEQSKV